jgi:G3E family GTPase
VGCSLAASFANLVKEFCRNKSPDLLFIEPEGIVTTAEMAAVSRAGLRDCSYEVGAFITLVDGYDFDMYWEERQALLVSQISGAHLVAVSKADLIDRPTLQGIRKALEPYASSVVELSCTNGTGLNTIEQAVIQHHTE